MTWQVLYRGTLDLTSGPRLWARSLAKLAGFQFRIDAGSDVLQKADW